MTAVAVAAATIYDDAIAKICGLKGWQLATAAGNIAAI